MQRPYWRVMSDHLEHIPSHRRGVVPHCGSVRTDGGAVMKARVKQLIDGCEHVTDVFEGEDAEQQAEVCLAFTFKHNPHAEAWVEVQLETGEWECF
jgi:hypothetical protein